MVRFENQAVKATPPVKGDYVYDQNYTFLWETVLKEPNNDRSFEKGDADTSKKQATEKMEALAMNVSSDSLPQAAEMQEEQKCAEEEDELLAPPNLQIHATKTVDTLSPTYSKADEYVTEKGTGYFDEGDGEDYEEYGHPHSATLLPEVKGLFNGGDSEEDHSKPSKAKEDVALAYNAEDHELTPEQALIVVAECAERVWSEKLKGSVKADPEMLSQLMAQIVSDAAKKELESRLKRQQEETYQGDGEPNVEGVDDDLVALQEGPMDAESLAKAQAKLLEQAKSLAKAQALILSQAKALALMEQGISPVITPLRRPKSPPLTPDSKISKLGMSRSPSDESRLKERLFFNASSQPEVAGSKLSKCNNPKPTSGFPVVASGLTNLDVEWLAQAKSEAQAKAQALIRTAQAEAAARAEARRLAKERALAEERARQKEEIEAQIKAKAARDAWDFEETQAAFRAEQRARDKAKAAAKAAAEDKLRRKADTDAATANVLEATRAQAKAEAEYKMRLKADADAKFLEECKARRLAERRARQEAVAKERVQMELDQELSEEDIKRRKAEAEEKIRLKAEADAKWLEECRIRRMEEARLRQEALERARIAKEQEFLQAKLEAEREQKIKEMAVAQAKANAEHKMRLKAEADAKWLEECKIRRAKEAEKRAQAKAEAEAEAKVRAKAMAAASNPPNEPGVLPPHFCLMKTVPQTIASAKKLLLEPPREFVAFGKSKGEELDGQICLYLQVPGVVHPTEVKVELEDGVLYISRGIILNGLDGVQKYTRSFPFEEALLDTQRISVLLIPGNATADGVSVLQFKLPKVQKTWKIPLSRAEPELVKEDIEGDLPDAPSSDKADEIDDQAKDPPALRMDAPDDEVSVQQPPSDEMKESEASGDDRKTEEVESAEHESVASSCERNSIVVRNTDVHRVVSLQVPPGFGLENISAIYGEESVRVVGHDGTRPSFRHVFAMNSKEVEVQELTGIYDPECGLLVIKGPLSNPVVSKPKARRIRVHKMDEPIDVAGIISVFQDDFSLSSRDCDSQTVSSSQSDKKKKNASIKSLASKYLKLRQKKHKHELP